MVRFTQIIGAAALLSPSVFAVPAPRRHQDSYMQNGDSYMQNGDSYMQPANYGQQDKYNKGNQYDTPPSYENKYTQPSYENKYTQPSYENKYTSEEEKKTAAYETTSAAYSTVTYGSGQNKWGKSYEDCVSQCVAQYGAPPKEWKPSESMAPPEGTGAVHTVMVAPMQGVLRYWPFAVNASVGDTIRYVWTTPQNHTATLSSALAMCNKSAKADELKWVSGVRNASDGTPQIFDVTIQTDEPQFFYCSVAQHCAKGMFGMVQPKRGGNNTVSFHMEKWLEASPDLKAAWVNVHEQTKGTSADNWGNNFDIDGIPEEAHMDLAQNIIWSRAMFAANPGSLEANSASTPDGSPVKIVGDLNTFLANTSQDPPSNVPAGTPTGPLPVPSVVASQLADAKNAGLKTSAPVWVAALVGAVSYLVL